MAHEHPVRKRSGSYWTRNSRRVQFLTLFSLIFLIALPALAQTAATGALSGTVMDQTGAAVPDSKITLTNQATGEVREFLSQKNGTYLFPQLSPGLYTVDISKAGFKQESRRDLRVNVTETTRLDFRLMVGAVSEKVEVQDRPSQVQTESSSLGRVVGEQAVSSLPLVNRNYTQIIGLSPGISTGVTNASDLGSGNGGQTSETEGEGLFVNGTRQYDSNFQIDGIEVNDVEGSGGETGGSPIPNPDTIQEFKVQTGQYDASYGRGAGANINIITKSGSNQFHGTVFEFFRNEALNANDYFSNLARQRKPELKQNQFGFTLGGPIKKDRLLFFASYQGTRQINGVAEATTSPTTGAVGGCRVSASGPALTNDRSRSALGALFGGRAGELGGVAVDLNGSNINPIALALLNLKLPDGAYMIPTPQTINPSLPPDSQGFSAFSQACTFNEDQVMGNVDFLHTSKSKISGRFFYSQSDTDSTFPQSANVPGFDRPVTIDFLNTSIAHTYIIHSNLLNEVRFGFHRSHPSFHPQAPFTWSGIGVTAAPQDNDVPCIEILGSYSPCAAYDEAFAQNTYDLLDSVSYIRGRHSFRFGGGLTLYQSDFLRYRNNDTLAFLSYPDFLLGMDGVTNGSGFSNIFESFYDTGIFRRDFRILDDDLYAQDDIKVAKTFTLNLGIRYDRIGPYNDASGRDVNFDFNGANPNPPAAGTLQGLVAPANYSGGTLPSGVIKSPNESSVENRGVNNLAPRIGFAWQVLPHSNRLVLRGGYGIYYSRPTGQTSFVYLSFTQPFSVVGLEFESSTPTFANPFEQPIPSLSSLPLFEPYSPTSSPGLIGVAQNFRPSIVQEYSTNLQTQVTPSVLLEVGYVGTRGTHLFRTVTPNQALSASPADPIRGQTDNTIANIPLRVPILDMSPVNINPYLESEGASWYNALEASATKRLSHGLQLQASYTFSKVLDTDGAEVIFVSGGRPTVGDQNDPKSRYGRTSFDRPQRFVLSYIYDLPSPNGHGAVLRTMLGGWSLAGVTTIQSGSAITLVSTNANNVFGITNDRAEIAAGCTNAQVLTPGTVQHKLNNYFNTACVGPKVPWPIIGADGVGTAFGDSGVGLVNGPDQNNWDIAIIKKTPVGRWFPEGSNVEFRTEFFNVFNHPQFGNPFTDVTASNFGQIQSTSVNPRIIQLALKLNF